MSWVKLATSFPRHPKALDAGPTARHLFIMSLCWSGQYNTDGLIPHYTLRSVLAIDAGVPLDEVGAVADRLVEVGLWERVPEGWKVHDWGSWQTPAEERNRKAELAKERKRRWKERRAAEHPENTDGERVPGAFAARSERRIEDRKQKVEVEEESSSSSSDLLLRSGQPGERPEEEEEDLIRMQKAAEVVALRRFDRRSPKLPPILDKGRWVRTTTKSILANDGQAMAYLARQGHPPAAIADAIEPDTAGLGVVSAARARQAKRKRQPVEGER